MKKEIMVNSINLTIDEFLDAYSGYVGCVYPSGEDSYFICSGGDMKLFSIQLLDGELYAEDSMRSLAEEGLPYTGFTYDEEAYKAAIEKVAANRDAYEGLILPDTKDYMWPWPHKFKLEDVSA